MTFTDTERHKHQRAERLLNEVRTLMGSATQGDLSRNAVADSYRRAEAQARHAVGVLSDLAFTFER